MAPNDAPPRYVVDGWGNLWHYFNDKGYLRLTVTTEPGRTLADIAQETGMVRTLAITEPTDLLRELVTRNGVR